MEDELVQRVRLDEAEADGSLDQAGAEQGEQDVPDHDDADYHGRLNSCPASNSCQQFSHIMLLSSRQIHAILFFCPNMVVNAGMTME